MIFVGGVPFPTDDSSFSSQSQEHDILTALMEHPVLVSASSSLNDVEERKFSVSKDSSLSISRHNRWVYIFQREYATVDPALVDAVGTDEATTCVGIVIRNQKSGMTSVAHLDSPDIVDVGLDQMLASGVNQSSDAMLDVHLIGGFDDGSPKHVNGITEGHAELEGYSFPLCKKILESLAKSNMKFQIHTLHVLGHNTRRDSEGNSYPIFSGLLVETATGSIFPANFDATTRCPDEVVRRIRVTAAFEDRSWEGRLLETYDTQNDQFVIAPCTWSMRKIHIALMLQNLSDQEILLTCSTSPSAEAPDFVDGLRRQWDYLIQHPDWKETFPSKQPHIFRRTEDNSWVRHCAKFSSLSYAYTD
ncbi:protein N-terminal asparagine amidohydrolase isoform X2 [Nicotiana tabacum]|uniref:Protein N-terminal asparagine amidohydrolase isoform X2 n=1 Tax=Nicotiana tabacum TaxID=4097 RepID=A0A1S4DKK7_TOBAC|nr:PREDICTED: protein N-terminal asparagine amidohydrolase-like isoform X2 [Nicotiana tabacum]